MPKTRHLLVVWNQQSEEEIRQGNTRTRLSSAISRSHGAVWEFFQNVESIHEETRVEAGPIRPICPAEVYGKPGYGAPFHGAKVRPPKPIVPLSSNWGRWTYPSVLVCEDRVLVAFGSVLKVFPIPWFYGGRDPTEENPALQGLCRLWKT